MAKLGKKKWRTKAKKTAAKMFGVKMLKPGFFHMQSVFSMVKDSLHSTKEAEAHSFQDIKELYNLSDAELSFQQRTYTKHGLFYFVFMCLLTAVVLFHGVEGFEEWLSLSLAVVVLLTLSLKSFYLAHLIRQKDLSIAFLAWLKQVISRRTFA